jgi:hypothetical protein
VRDEAWYAVAMLLCVVALVFVVLLAVRGL